MSQTEFNNKDFNEFVKDVTNLFTGNVIDLSQYIDIISTIQTKIEDGDMKRKYTSNDANDYADMIKEYMSDSNSFTKTDIYDYARLVKKDNKRRKKNKHKSKNESVMDNMLETIGSLISEIMVALVSILVTTNIYFRLTLPAGLLFPHDFNKFPYVYFKPGKCREQEYMLSGSLKNTQTSHVDYIFKNTSTEKTKTGDNSKDNYCKINDPYGISDSCDSGNFDVETKEALKVLMGKLTADNNASQPNIDMFANIFMNTNKKVNSNDFGLFSLIAYISLYIIVFINKSFAGLHRLSQNIPHKTDGSIMSIVSFIVLCACFYLLFSNSKDDVSNAFESMFKTGDKKSQKLMDVVLDFVSALGSGTIGLFKILSLIMFPIALIGGLFGYLSIAKVSNGLFTKGLCYYGVFISLLTAVGFIGFIANAVRTASKNKLSIGDNIINNMNMIEALRDAIKSIINIFKPMSTGKNIDKNFNTDIFFRPLDLIKMITLIIIVPALSFVSIMPILLSFLMGAKVAFKLTISPLMYLTSIFKIVSKFSKSIGVILALVLLNSLFNTSKKGNEMVSMIAIITLGLGGLMIAGLSATNKEKVNMNI